MPCQEGDGCSVAGPDEVNGAPDASVSELHSASLPELPDVSSVELLWLSPLAG